MSLKPCHSDMQGAGRTRRRPLPSAGALQYRTRRKTYSQILAVTLRNNKKYLNQSRVNAFNNPPVSQESFQKCAPACIRLSLHCPAGTWVAHLLVWSPLLPWALARGASFLQSIRVYYTPNTPISFISRISIPSPLSFLFSF